MQVQYCETKTGFECMHLPSIDISSIDPTVKTAQSVGHRQMTSSTSAETSFTAPVQSRPSIMKKASKLSFVVKRDKEKDKDKDKGKERDYDDKEKESARQPSGGTATLAPTHSSASSSFFAPPSNHTAVAAQGEKGTAQTNGSTTAGVNVDNAPTPTPTPTSYAHPHAHAQDGSSSSSPPRSYSPVAHSSLSSSNKAKVLPPIPRDFAKPASPLPSARSPSPLPTGEVDKDVFETMGNTSLSVRFEINIIKVRFLYNQLMLLNLFQ
jgi:hypothetical protein